MPRVTHMYIFRCVCAHVCVNNEISPFSGFLLSHYVDKTYIHVDSFDFSSCETMFLFYMHR